MYSPLMRLWLILNKTSNVDFDHVAETFNISQAIARMIRNRDVVTDEEISMYLFGTEMDFYPPQSLKDMDKAVRLLEEKIRLQKKCLIIGDYDIDGVTASYIIYKGLSRLGLECGIRIPHRINDGYGVNESMIEEAIKDKVDTIITCDNGIAAYEEFKTAKENGLTVIITDHHEIPYMMEGSSKAWILPPADAIINPNQEDCKYKNKNICGAALAMKLITALYELFSIPAEEIREFYEFAAIATVGDVVDLKDENRVIVKEGLKRIHSTGNIGLQELIKAVKLEDKEINSYHIGFIIGPCINASGRLETAELALRLFTTNSREEAQKLAENLVALNEERKAMTEKGVSQAVEIIENEAPINREDSEHTGGIDKVLVVYLPDCHESLAGIIAGRLRERYSRPAFVLTNGQNGVKGSGRSIDEYSMYDELVKCSSVLEKFGGHPLAAGISLKKENIEAFRKMINENCTLTARNLSPKIKIDVQTNLKAVSLEIINQLKVLEPYGKANPKPVFVCKYLSVKSVSVVGKNKKVVKLRLSDQSGCTRDAVYFTDAEKFMEDLGGRKGIYSLVYYPNANEYNGFVQPQMVITDYRMDPPSI